MTRTVSEIFTCDTARPQLATISEAAWRGTACGKLFSLRPSSAAAALCCPWLRPRSARTLTRQRPFPRSPAAAAAATRVPIPHPSSSLRPLRPSRARRPRAEHAAAAAAARGRHPAACPAYYDGRPDPRGDRAPGSQAAGAGAAQSRGRAPPQAGDPGDPRVDQARGPRGLRHSGQRRLAPGCRTA